MYLGQKWQYYAVIIGSLGIITVLLLRQQGLNTDTQVNGETIKLLFPFVLILIVGCLGDKFSRMHQQVGFIVLNTFIMILLFDSCSVFYLLLQSRQTPEDLGVHHRPGLSYYQAHSWGQEYWREQGEVETTHSLFHPYTIWTYQPYDGQFINISADGLRVTPDTECEADAYTIFFFGGSTVWGTGVPDWGTIPAYLQTLLAGEWQHPLCIINYGQIALVSTQSLINLNLQLRDGKRPNLVIFLDGINDVYAAYQAGEAGVPQNLESLEKAITGDQTSAFLRLTAQNSHLVYLLVTRLGRFIQPQSSHLPEITRNQLPPEIVDTYLGNYQSVEALANYYGFQFYFFWQPVLDIKPKPLSPEEQAIFNDIPQDRIQLYESTYGLLRETAGNYPYLYLVDDTFATEEKLVFIDDFDLTAEGNALIAEKIAGIILDDIPYAEYTALE